MKKFLISTVIAAMFLLSCVNNTEPIFDELASKRLDNFIMESKRILTSAEAGWHVEYFPQKNQKYGGYNLFFKFESNGNVTVMSEIDPSASATSVYDFGRDAGATLNFTTYNSVFNYFSDPRTSEGGGTGLGFEGDYEFIIIRPSATDFVLHGKKTLSVVHMTPFSDNSWADFCQKIADMKTAITSVQYNMKVENKDVESIVHTSETKTFAITYVKKLTETTSTEVTESAKYIITPAGIKFYKPVTIMGQAVQNFTFDYVNNILICTDAGINAQIICY